MDLQEALKIVEKINPKRMSHILGVVDQATHLAKRYNVNLYKSQLAAALHDIAKNMSISDMETILNTYNPTYLQYSTNVYHGPVGRYLLENEYNVTDESILNAVEFHVTGHPEMDDVLKVVYISDYTERGRTHPQVHYCRTLSEINLDVGVLAVSESILNYLQSKHMDDIHPLSIQTYELFLEKVGEDTYESIKNHYQRHLRR